MKTCDERTFRENEIFSLLFFILEFFFIFLFSNMYKIFLGFLFGMNNFSIYY